MGAHPTQGGKDKRVSAQITDNPSVVRGHLDSSTLDHSAPATFSALCAERLCVGSTKSLSRFSRISDNDMIDVPPSSTLSISSSVDFSQMSLTLRDKDLGFVPLHFKIARWIDGATYWVNPESDPDPYGVNLSFLFWSCALLLLAVVGSMSIAYRINDAAIMNFAAVTACFLLVAILHICCLRHSVEAIGGSDHGPEVTTRYRNRTLGRPSVLGLTSFAWIAWGLILFLCLAGMALLRLPIPVCDTDVKAEQVWFPSCRPPPASREVFISLGLPCRIITAVTVVLGISHAAFSFYILCM